MSSAYFISNSSYLRWTVGGGAVDAGYPTALSNGWSGIMGTGFENGFDAAVDLGKGKLYFFKGNSYIRIDNATNTVESAVAPIAGNWPGTAESGLAGSIDAAVNYGDGKVYFFRADQYLGYDIEADAATGTGQIGADWGGLADAGFADSIDAAVNWGTGVIYLFRGDQYVTYDIAQDTTTGPAPVATDWPGFEENGFVPTGPAWVRLESGSVPPVEHPSVGRAGAGDCIWYHDHKVYVGSEIPRLTWFPGADRGVDTDYQGHGTEIFEFVVHSDGQILRGQPHMRTGRGSFAWLNRNPGNIMLSRSDFGQYPGKFNWHNFMIFPAEEAGFAAIGSLLRGPIYAHLSILEALKKYAPAGDGGNNPMQYATDVAAAAGVTIDTTINALSDDQLRLVQEKIRAIEGSVPGDTLSVDSPEVPSEVRALLV